jgi:glycosyltransferase involved in cell wall biosynthesis
MTRLPRPATMPAATPWPARPAILALLAQLTGCEWYRVLLPLSVLRERGWSAAWLPVSQMSSLLEAFRHQQAAQAQPPILVLPRLAMPAADRSWLWTWAERHGVRLIYECDDDLWQVPPENPASQLLQPLQEELRATLQLCHGATTTNPRLAARLQQEAGWPIPVQIVPNAIDQRLWQPIRQQREWQWKQRGQPWKQRPPKRGGRAYRESHRLPASLVVGAHGSASHRGDWQVLVEAWVRVAERYPQLRFETVGYCPPELPARLGSRLRCWPFASLDAYPALIARQDITCCPLLDRPFNWCKTPIKLYESIAAGAACVVSEVLYGEVVAQARQAGQTIAEVIPLAQLEQPARCQQLRQQGWCWVRQQAEIQVVAPRWERAYQQLAHEASEAHR